MADYETDGRECRDEDATLGDAGHFARGPRRIRFIRVRPLCVKSD